MKSPCPRCGRGTAIEEDVGDFPMRCERCGALLRRRPNGEEMEGVCTQGAVVATRAKRGTLAGMLIRQQDAAVAVCEKGHAGVLRPESRQVVAQAHARQQALEKAQQRGSQQAIGALTWMGIVLALLLGIGAVVLKAQAMWQRPSVGAADVVRGLGE